LGGHLNGFFATGPQSRSKTKFLKWNNFGPEVDIAKIQTLVFIVFYGLYDPIKSLGQVAPLYVEIENAAILDKF